MISKKTLFIIFGLLYFSLDGVAQESRYFGQTELGFLYGRSEEQLDGKHEKRFDVSFLTFNGVHVTKNQVIGLVTGLDQYEEISIIPIALGWRGFLGKDDKPQIFAGLDLGGGSAVLERKITNEWSKSWYEGGLLFSPSIGIAFPAKKGKSAFSMSVAYKSQAVTYFQGSLAGPGAQTIVSDQLPPGFNSLNETEHLYRSLAFRIGIMY